MDLIPIIINAAAHCVGFSGMLCLTFMVFGRPDSAVHTFSPISHFVLKAAMTAITIGHAFAAASMVVVPTAEICLNIGVATMWWWIAWFHWYVFLKTRPTKHDGRPTSDDPPPTQFETKLGMKRPYK